MQYFPFTAASRNFFNALASRQGHAMQVGLHFRGSLLPRALELLFCIMRQSVKLLCSAGAAFASLALEITIRAAAGR